MYIWKIKVEEKWEFDKSWLDSDVEYTVSAKTLEDAWKKVKPLVISQKFDDDEKPGLVHRCTDARIIFAERGAELDA